MKNIYKFLISISIPLTVGAMAGYFTSTSVKTWFVTLQKPTFNPPSWLFAPVWTILYILMGIAFFLIWKSSATNTQKKPAYSIYWVQLALNFIWSLLFFYSQNPGAGLIDIVLLLIAILFTIKQFYAINKTSAFLLVPYVLWVLFATALNTQIWRLNS